MASGARSGFSSGGSASGSKSVTREIGTRTPDGVAEPEGLSDGPVAPGFPPESRPRLTAITVPTTARRTTPTTTARRNQLLPGGTPSPPSVAQSGLSAAAPWSTSGPQAGGTGPFPAPVLRCAPVKEPVEAPTGSPEEDPLRDPRNQPAPVSFPLVSSPAVSSSVVSSSVVSSPGVWSVPPVYPAG